MVDAWRTKRRIMAVGLLGILLAFALVPRAIAAEQATEPPADARGDVPLGTAIRAVGLALAAAITLASAALATARVQAAVGAGGTGALAEKPELFTTIVILIAIPETLVILGFVLAYLMVAQI